MTLSLRVFTKDGEIGVADLAYSTLEQIYKQYGNCKVWVYDRNAIFGVGYDGAKPIEKTTIEKLEW